ncbi:MAG: hypothetical protein AVDCRST_MAG22-1904 [uncultured Rubrobacteraceae bacterium]|uniref:DUF305 domain-containing protein n=1 Tax=uncultured Rubrobacteraceae bacterium TaxID=349277 RepID=A0A6J4PEM0_9ACTN|nr:MAG: hypothetical protein AVDCRST_MAG22-1904 [uncultured Rubrobacteraceae bacterium]
MKHHTRLALAGLLSAVALTVAACGGAGGSAGDTNDGGAGEGQKNRGMGGMDHSQMDRASDGMASGMLMENGRYSDRRFIDAMVPHHRGAVEMAEVALENAGHEQIEQLAEEIISTQESEIRELKKIKQEEFGTSRVPMGMEMGQMQGMGMMEDPRSLADEEPFDRAFIDNMLPHHGSAIQMANVALEKSDNPRIEELAGEIVRAQEREISQMRTWRENWYPEG